MPDAITPVGTMYSQQNPIAALSSIYGLQQQQIDIAQRKQNLQTGQYAQQSVQAGAQQDQMKSAQLQGATKLAQQAYTSGRYRNPDTGDFDSEKFANDVSALGPYAQQMANDITVRAGETYKNQQTLFNLDNSRKAEIANAYGALAAKENPTHADLADTNTNLILQHPDDPKFVRMITSIGQSVDPNANGQGLKQKALNFAQMAGAPSAMPTAGTVDTGGTIQPGTFAPPLQGGAFKPAGGSVQKTLAPAQQIPYVGAAAAASSGGTALGSAQTANLTGVAGRVQQAQSAANNTVQSIDALNRAKSILESPNAPSTGTQYESVKGLKNLMSSLGIDTTGADDMNTLTKNLARYEATRATQAGLGGTDAARELAHSGSPNTQLDNKALLGIVRQSLATEQAVGSYANVQSKATNPQQMLQNENAFRNIPNHIQAREYGMMRTPQEADAYLKAQGMSKADMATARAKVKEFDSQ